MNTTVKVLLIGGGVAFLFRDQLISLLGAGTSTAAPELPQTTVAPPNPNSGVSDAVGTYELMLAKVRSDPGYIANGGRMNIDQWNYYYALVRGIPGPTSDVIGFSDAKTLVSLDEYWNAMTAHGLSGLRLMGRVRGGR